MAIIKASSVHIDKLKEFEGFKAEPYSDMGLTAQGYGHQGVIANRPITEEEAFETLKQDVAEKELIVSGLITREDLTQGQKDVAIDMAYNVKMSVLKKAKFFERINAGDFDSVYASLGEYTKATDNDRNSPTYGQLIELPGLVKRAQYRQQLWGSPGDRQAAEGVDFNSLALLEDEEFTTEGPELPSDDNEAPTSVVDFNELALMDSETEGPPAPKNTPIDSARIMSKDVDPIQQSQVKMISKAYKVNEADAQAMLGEAKDRGIGFSDLMLVGRGHQEGIEAVNKGLSRWAAKPQNYPLLAQDPIWAKAVDSSAFNLKRTEDWFSDLGNAFWYNVYDFRIPSIHAQIALGTLPLAHGIQELENLTNLRDQYPIEKYRKGVDNILRGVDSFSSRVGRSEKLIKAAWAMDDHDTDRLMPLTLSLFSGAVDSFYGLMDFAHAVKNDPGAMALITAQSVGQALVPMAFRSIGGAVAGAPGAALMGFVGGALTGFGQRMQERMQDFKDPKTGKPDYFLYYSDPNRIQEDRLEAAKYGTTLGLAEGASAFLISRVASKLMKLAADSKVGVGNLGRLARIGKEVGKGLAVEPATEAIGEFAAQKVTGAETGEAAGQALLEGASAAGMAPAHLALGYASEKMYQARTNKEKVTKIVNEVTEATKAAANYDKIKTLRAATEASEIKNTHPDQTAELVDTAIGAHTEQELAREDGLDRDFDTGDAQTTYESEDSALDNESSTIESEISDIANNRAPDVRVSIDDWDAVHNSQGLDPLANILAYDEELAERYTEAKETGGELVLTPAEYIAITSGVKGIDEVMRLGDSKHNAKDAFPILEMLETEGPKLMTKDSDKDIEFKFEEGAPEEGEPVLRPIELIQRYRTPDEKNVHGKLKRSISRALKGTKSDSPEIADVMAELQFRHIRFKSEVLGRPIEQIADETIIRQQEGLADKEGTIGFHQAIRDHIGTLVTHIVFDSKETKPNAVVHEFAHAWLTEMVMDWDFVHSLQSDKMTEAQRDYQEAMKLVAEMFKVDSLADFKTLFKTPEGVEKYRAFQETFAQTAERYYLEGEFKNNRIRKVFEVMRKWMKKFSSIVGKAYPQYPPFKIDPKVERVFEILTDSSDKVEELVHEMFPEPMFDTDILGEKAEKYIEMVRKAKDEAIGEIYSRMFHRNMDAREKLIEKNVARIQKEAEEEVDLRPSMQLARAFKEASPDERISYKSFVDTFANGDEAKAAEIRKQIPRQFVAGKKKAGIEVSNVMAALEISNSDDLMKLMVEAGMRDELIEDLSNQKIDSEFPAMKTDEEIHQIAVEAMNRDGRDKILREEMRILTERYLTELKQVNRLAALPASVVNRMAKAAIKTRAMRVVSNAYIARFSPESFLRISQKYGRQAADALYRRNDVFEALTAKQREMEYFQAYRDAMALKPRLASIGANIKRMRKAKMSEIAKYYDTDIYGFGKRMLQNMAESKPLPLFNPNLYLDSIVVSEEAASRLNALIGTVNIAHKGKPLAYAKVDVFAALGEALGIVRKMARDSKSAIAQGKRVLRDQIAEGIEAEIGPAKAGDPKPPGDRKYLMKSAVRGYQVFKNANVNYTHLLASLFKDEESFAKSIIVASTLNPASEAEAEFTLKKREIDKNFKDGVRALVKKDKLFDIVFGPLLNRVGLKTGAHVAPIFSKQLNITFKGGIFEVMMAILHTGSESGRRKFLLGGFDGVTRLADWDSEGQLDSSKWDAFVNELIENKILRKEHFDFMQLVWDTFAGLHGPAKAGIKHVHGYEIGKIEARPIKTPWGTYSGGYIPASREQSYADLVEASSDFTLDDQAFKGHDLFPTTDIGFAEQRNEKIYPLNLNMELLPMLIHRVLQAAYLKPTMYEVGKILQDERVRGIIEDRRPGAYEDIIIPWFNRTVAQHYTVPAGTNKAESRAWAQSIDTAVGVLRRRQRVAAFIFNTGSALKQYTGLFPAMAVVKPKYIAKAVAKVNVSPGKYKDEIASLDPQMKVRFEENFKRAQLAAEKLDLNADWVSWTSEKVDYLAHFMIQGAQNHVDVMVWLAAKEQAFDLGILNEKEAVAYATQAVKRTQYSTDLSVRPSILHGPEYKRILTDFLSYNINNYGLLFTAEGRVADEKMLAKYQKLIPAYLAILLIPTTLGYMIGMGGAGVSTKEEEEEDELEKFGAELLQSYIGTKFPVVGDVVSNVLRGRDPLPIVRSLKSVNRAVESIRQASQDVTLAPWQVRDMNMAITLLTGVPLLSPVTVPLKIREMTETEEEKRTRELTRRYELRIMRLKQKEARYQ